MYCLLNEIIHLIIQPQKIVVVLWYAAVGVGVCRQVVSAQYLNSFEQFFLY